MNLQMKAASPCDGSQSVDIESTEANIIRALLQTFMCSLRMKKYVKY